MALTKVELTSEVFWTCAAHALSTEAEEVMGLLLGDILYSDGVVTARVWVAMPQIRTDRRKDRVEASPEQMARCSAVAERFSAVSGVQTRVVGWYHSHPHITVLPSHVDVASQAMYQQLDEGFVGIIISAFNEDATTLAQTVQVTAFQSAQQMDRARSVARQSSSAGALLSEGSLDSPMARAMAASAEEVQAAPGSWQRAEVPLAIVPSRGSAEQTLSDLTALLGVLFQEERSAYGEALAAARDGEGAVPVLAAAHHAAVYQQHLCKLIEIILGPTQQALDLCATQAKLQAGQLKQLQAHLTSTRQALSAGPSPPPSHRETGASSAAGSSSAQQQHALQQQPPPHQRPFHQEQQQSFANPLQQQQHNAAPQASGVGFRVYDACETAQRRRESRDARDVPSGGQSHHQLRGSGHDGLHGSAAETRDHATLRGPPTAASLTRKSAPADSRHARHHHPATASHPSPSCASSHAGGPGEASIAAVEHPPSSHTTGQEDTPFDVFAELLGVDFSGLSVRTLDSTSAEAANKAALREGDT